MMLDGSIPAAVLLQLTAPQRFSPMLAGASQIRVGRTSATLTVRTPSEDVVVEAPANLLDLIFKWCDGTRTVQEVINLAKHEGKDSDFGEFLSFLITEGALIDANLASANAAQYAFQFSPFGLAAPRDITDKVCRRFLQPDFRSAVYEGVSPSTSPSKVAPTPLAELFENRVTSYTFDGKTITADVLEQFLWSFAGVVRVNHPRAGYKTPQRTLASAGGMHLLEVYVALQLPVGSYSPGIYRVYYPDENQVSLEKVSADIELLPLAFGKPWDLTYAVGSIFLAADAAVAAMRYRSRSLQYLFMEAGAALQNGALSSSPLGLGFATIGGYYERPVARLCNLNNQLILGAAIFGAKASTEQQTLIQRSPDIDFAWVNGESARYSMGFHLARAKIISDDDERPHTWGRGTDPKLATVKAIAEAIEREGFRQPRDILEGCKHEIADAISPEEFVRYRKQQYQNPNFFYKPFSPTQKYPWALATRLNNGEPARVLGELVFSRDSLRALGYDTSAPYTQVTSSGCAASTTKADATLRALLEVVERHAFMYHWLTQTPGLVIRHDELSKAINQRLSQMETVGCRVTIQCLPVPWAHVALVSAQHQDHHFTTMGTAAAFDMNDAIESALDEVEARVYAWLHGHTPGISHFSEVASTEHHFEIYGLKRYFRRADRVLFPKEFRTSNLPDPFQEITLDAMVKSFTDREIFPLALDISPEKSWIDQGRTRLFVVKALVPGLLPVYFGHQTEPLGMLSKVHSASRFPHPFP